MKKLFSVILVTLLLTAVFSICALAFGGSGIEAMAKEVTMVKTGLLGRRMVFSDVDFKSAFSLDDFGSITVRSLPKSTDGALLLAGRRVREGQTIRRRNIAAMIFVPDSEQCQGAEFTFTLDGGPECICEMRFIEKINYAPSIDTGGGYEYITTMREVGVHGRVNVLDPEGDKIEYIVVRYPRSGRLVLDDEGAYVYTPEDDFTGYDTFTIVARDEYGNYSEAISRDVRVIERTSEMVLVDMIGDEAYNAALALTGMGAMEVRAVGSRLYFDKDTVITREEFVASAMRSMGLEPSVGCTLFDDDGDIGENLKGYIKMAKAMGVVNGELESGRLVFKPKEGITLPDAAVIITALLGISDFSEAEYTNFQEAPAYARAALDQILTLGIIDEGSDIDAPLTRGEAAMMLYKMVNNS